MIGPVDLAVVVAIAVGCSVAVSVLGALVLRGIRTRSTSAQLVVVVCTSLGALLAGAIGTSAAMFLSGHDLQVLLVVALVSGAVGLTCALLLGRAVVAASLAVEAVAARLGEAPYVSVPGPLPAELDRQLARTSVRLEEDAIANARRRRPGASWSRG